MGRKSRLESVPEIAEALADELRAGQSVRNACLVVGLSEAAYHRYVAGAEPVEGDGINDETRALYRNFRELVTRARAEKCSGYLRKIEAHGEDDWRALAWLAEKTEPDLYGNRSKIEAHVTLHDPVEEITRLIARLTPEDEADETPPQLESGGG